MVSEKKIKNSFVQARKDLTAIKYELWNKTRFLEYKTT